MTTKVSVYGSFYYIIIKSLNCSFDLKCIPLKNLQLKIIIIFINLSLNFTRFLKMVDRSHDPYHINTSYIRLYNTCLANNKGRFKIAFDKVR